MSTAVKDGVSAGQMATELRKFADQIERGDFSAVAFAAVDQEGNGAHGVLIDPDCVTPDMIDEMVHNLKSGLFDALGD